MVNLSLLYNYNDIYRITYNNNVVKQVNYNGTKVWDYRSAYQTYCNIFSTCFDNSPNITKSVTVATNSPYSSGTTAENRMTRGGVIAIYNPLSCNACVTFKGTQTSPQIDTYAYLLSSDLVTQTYNDDGAGSSQPLITATLNKYSLYYIIYTTYNILPTQSALAYSLTVLKNKLYSPSITLVSSESDSYGGGDTITLKITNNDSDSDYIVYYWSDSTGETLKSGVTYGNSFTVTRSSIYGAVSLNARCQTKTSTIQNSLTSTYSYGSSGGSTSS